MSDIHILTTSAGRTRLVLHIAVPDANNSVSVNYRTALLSSGIGGTTSLPDGDGTAGTISSAEKSAIEAGEIYETSASLDIDGQGTTTGSRAAAIRAEYVSRKAAIVALLQRRLKFYGSVLEETP